MGLEFPYVIQRIRKGNHMRSSEVTVDPLCRRERNKTQRHNQSRRHTGKSSNFRKYQASGIWDVLILRASSKPRIPKTEDHSLTDTLCTPIQRRRLIVEWISELQVRSMVNFKAIQMSPLYPNMDGQMLTKHFTQVEEIMMNKLNYFWRKKHIYYRNQRTLPKNPNSQSQNCKDDRGFIKQEQGAIKGKN